MRRSFVALALALVLPLPALAGQVTVKDGETLSEIADRHGISVSRLMQINGILNADLVEAGRKLTVPSSGGGGASHSGGGNGRVTVQDGETLSEIADRHGMSVSRLIGLNNISDPDHVEAGRTLVVTGRAQGSSSGSSGGSSYRKGASEHVVRAGESLSVIADGYGIGLSKLIAINAIADPDLVEAGTRLRLKGNPAAPKPATPKPAASRPAAPAPRPRPVESPVTPSPEPRPAPIETASITPTTVTPVTPRVTSSVARPASTPVASKPTVIASASKPVSSVPPSSKADWRTYGPLQVDWSNWQPMGGSMVAPTLNSRGESLYMAINCGARKINATSQAGLWKTWDDPQADFEQQLVNYYCKNSTL